MLARNLVHFARVLRAAGLSVGPDRVLQAIGALEAVGLGRRDDVHAALSAVMLDRHEQQVLFDAAFARFWRDPKLLEQVAALRLPQVVANGRRLRPELPRRLRDALAAPGARPEAAAAPSEPLRFDAVLTFSERERLQQADFETMTAQEFEQARRLAEQVPLPVDAVRRRRQVRAARGHIDLRATLMRMARSAPALQPVYTHARTELPPLVVLLDVSGSMDRYARLFLHFVHGLGCRHPHVHTLTFGTRLTNITRSLRHRDPDVALALAGHQVADWKGGTRIAACLDEFNRRWARRLLGGNAAVLLVTDGLDHGDGVALDAAAARLHRLAHQVVWLNPLLRFAGFEPRAAGVRALLPHVDRFLPVHNLASLSDLGQALRAPPARPGRRAGQAGSAVAA